jgi:hypothetical protein
MEKYCVFLKKFINNTVNKFGCDKFLHFLVGAWFTSMVTPLGVWWVIAMFITVIVLSYIKEFYIDDIADNKDIIAGVLGSASSIIIWFIISVLFL